MMAIGNESTKAHPDMAGWVPDYRNKGNITIKQILHKNEYCNKVSQVRFWFPIAYKSYAYAML